MNKRHHYTPEFKTKVVLEVLQEEATFNEIAARYVVSPVMLSRWKSEFLERATDVFKKGSTEDKRNWLLKKNEWQHLSVKLVSY